MRVAAMGLVLALALPGHAWAESVVNTDGAALDSAMIGNGVVTLGVGRDGQIVGLGLGNVFVTNDQHTAGSGWSLASAGLPANDGVGTAAVESFATWGTGATSIVRLDDPATGGRFRISHTFRPSEIAPNLYEVLVTVENIGTTAMQPDYRRLLAGQQPITAPLSGSVPSGWHLQPTQDGKNLAFNVDLLMIEPGASQAFRLYYAVSANPAEARAALQQADASVVSESRGPLTLAFGYAAGAASPVEDGGTSSGGGGGDGGGTGNGGGTVSGGGAGNGGSAAAAGGAGGTGSGGAGNGGNGGNGGNAGGAGGAGASGGAGGAGGVSGSNQPPAGQTLTDSSTPKPPTTTEPPLNDMLQPGALPSETPELNALTLLGTGLLGMSGYAAARWRSRKQPPSDTTPESD
jgi:hypothetical protein